MRPLEETRLRWQTTQSHSKSLIDLQDAVKHNGSSSPCLSGHRSVCWKIFLLCNEGPITNWTQDLDDRRSDYAENREHFLKFIHHPEALTELSVDPLADDPESPWNTVRQDEVTRAEIRQDVLRLPDEANYHEEHIQNMVLDILFIYCKVNPNNGGYRQGMHELVAPLINCLEHDSLDRGAIAEDSQLEESMVNVLDSAFVEHDAYILFSRLMEHAQCFYEVSDGSGPSQHNVTPLGFREQRSAIVDRSKHIHEVCLRKVDPQLAAHLKNIEILPQIFLIRWIRLLFSREFPFSQFLILWDTMFAVDPSLKLMDLICVAMLLRIRWQLLEADYSVCLQLLLKYPVPEQPHGPHTFVDDAVYLRDHLDAAGGSSLIMKYTGKMPESSSRTKDIAEEGREAGGGTASLRQQGAAGKRAAASPSRFTPQSPSMEAFFQEAARGARGVLKRGEKLGINQAVRDAMGEIRKNVQSFNEARQAQGPPRTDISDEGAARALAAMERRNQQLASLLNETVANLKSATLSNLEDKAKSLELIEVAAAKIQFVQIYLEDATLDIPAFAPPKPNAAIPPSGGKAKAGDKGSSVAAARREGSPGGVKPRRDRPTTEDTSTPIADDGGRSPQASKNNDILGTTKPDKPKMESEGQTAQGGQEEQLNPLGGNIDVKTRPVPVPTRSTLAQSSFSWMLEPDESSPSRSPVVGSKSPTMQHKKKSANNHQSRERNAFLFGEVTAVEGGDAPVKADDIFGLEPLPKQKAKLSESLFEGK